MLETNDLEQTYDTPTVTVDVALFTLIGSELSILLAYRQVSPYLGSRALPGGYVHVDKDIDLGSTAQRVLATKANLVSGYFLEQLGTFSGIARDPRGWSVSTVYYAVVPFEDVSDDLKKDFINVEQLPPLPFDHNHILDVSIARIRGKSGYSTLPAFMLPKEFTTRELHEVYEKVMNVRLDQSSFRRKIDELGLLKILDGKMRKESKSGRPSQIYTLADDVLRQFDRTI